MEPNDYEEWIELFMSMMSSMDPNWDTILQGACPEIRQTMDEEQDYRDMRRLGDGQERL